MKKVYIGVGVVAVVVVVGLAAWFVPQTAATNYKNVVGDEQSSLNDSVSKMVALLSKDTFTKSDVEPNEVRSDVASGNEAVKDFETKRDTVKGKLTSLPGLLLMDWQPAYGKASQLKNKEEAYLQKADAFTSELKATLTYFEKAADLSQKSNDFATSIEEASNAESSEEFTSTVDAALKDFEPIIAQAKAVTPPASLKESHEYQITTATQFVELLKQLSSTVKTNDEAKATSASEKLSTLQKEATTKQEAFQAAFISSSPLRKMSNDLSELNREITKQQAAI